MEPGAQRLSFDAQFRHVDDLAWVNLAQFIEALHRCPSTFVAAAPFFLTRIIYSVVFAGRSNNLCD